MLFRSPNDRVPPPLRTRPRPLDGPHHLEQQATHNPNERNSERTGVGLILPGGVLPKHLTP